MKIFISFIGSNDAGKLAGKDQDGAVFTILKESKFDRILLLYNNRKGKSSNPEIQYSDIANYLKEKIISNNYVSDNNIEIHEIDFNDPADHNEVYRNLYRFLNEKFSEDDFEDNEFFVGISSGTPAMQATWIIFAEADIFPFKLLRSVEKRYAENGRQVKEVELLTGINEKLNKLKTIGVSDKNKLYEVRDSMNLENHIKKIGLSDKPILITGETGVGKEVLAKSLHDASNRKSKQLIPLNCAGFTETLLESELFGYKKGAFTGANQDRDGIVKKYSDGTLFLDEINSMPLNIQAKLLRFLEDGSYRQVGSNDLEKSDLRIIAATNQKLSKLVAEGKFREDLYYRLRTFELSIPPLRKRPEDIPFFLDRLNVDLKLIFDSNCIDLLKSHPFNGNIRELKIILVRLNVVCKDKKIKIAELRQVLKDFVSIQDYEELNIPKELEGKAFELVRKILINAALYQTDGNLSKAAGLLGVTHPTIAKYKNED